MRSNVFLRSVLLPQGSALDYKFKLRENNFLDNGC